MDKVVYLVCGPAGCGKSTWIQNDIAENDAILAEMGEPSDSIWISRDKVRFSLVPEDAPYFSQETRVFHKWIDEINAAISNPIYKHIYADATHLTPSSRRKTLSNLSLGEGVKVIAVNFLVPEEICVAQNAQRTGRALVPESVVRKMCHDFVPAGSGENFNFYFNVERGE